MVADPSPRKQAIAAETAKMLIECKAILFSEDKPFIFTSGLASPVYTDMRKVIAYSRIRTRLTDFAIETIETEIGYESLDAIAGGETAGIPFAAWIADRMHLPMQYIRKKPKGFGRDARIEGEVRAGARVLLVEDLATDGGSKVSFCEGLRQAGERCDHAFVFFFYDIFPKARETMAALGVDLHFLVTWRDILIAARHGSYFESAVLDRVGAFLDQPLEWSAAHGGVAELAPKP
jgi:orotate phosphoribosyltransferase